MADIVTQDSQRREIRPVDQFGRKWHGFIEIRTGDLTGIINAVGFVDPLKTNRTKYITLATDEGYSNLSKAYIAFDQWIDEVTADEAEWYRHLREVGRLQYKKLDQTGKVTSDLENDPYIREIAGPKPWPSSVVLKAARDGDRQYLGLAELDDAHRYALGHLLTDDQKRAAEAPAKVVDVPQPVAGESYGDFMKRVGQVWNESKKNAVAA